MSRTPSPRSSRGHRSATPRHAPGFGLLVGASIVLSACVGAGSSVEQPVTPRSSLSGTLTIFAAASLTETFGELEARLEARHPQLDVVVVLAGSATLVQQLIAGAPADVLASADETTMQLAVDAGAVEAPNAFARNPLALAVPAGNPGRVDGLDDLERADLVVALCASEVPCGRAADALLADLGVAASVDTRESDVRAVLTKVQLGEVDVGIVYGTDVRVAGEDVETIDVDAVSAQRFAPTYHIAIAEGTARRAAAEAWLALVLGDEGRSVLDSAGFDTATISRAVTGDQP
ncbi:MAG: molybdate ABC transporter substrate-binding protein [Microcella sp.]|uniref:molybdate ABC transporter substrate-binding protein n=1 Tax=Microcella sp. TaxID=1913979 RepID=UPI003315830D